MDWFIYILYIIYEFYTFPNSSHNNLKLSKSLFRNAVESNEYYAFGCSINKSFS